MIGKELCPPSLSCPCELLCTQLLVPSSPTLSAGQCHSSARLHRGSHQAGLKAIAFLPVPKVSRPVSPRFCSFLSSHTGFFAIP